MESLPSLTIIIGIFFLMLGFFANRLFSTFFRQKNTKIPTEANQAEKQRKILEEVTQVIKEGVIVANKEDLIIWTNRKALEILKTSVALTQNKPINQVLPKNNNGDEKNYQSKLTTLDQEEIDVSVSKFPLLNLESNIYVITDITEKIALEEMKLNFVAIAAHQLRTPLTAIKGYLFMLQNSIIPKLNPDEKNFFESTVIGADRMGFLIENLLNLSKVEKGELKINFKPVNLESITKQTVEGLLTYAKEKNVNILYGKFSKPLPVIAGDAGLLVEALSNVIGNAIKYSNTNGQVIIDLIKQGDGVSIHVSDKGKGIPAELIPRLFQKFYGATKSLTELSSGLGLGLFISKSIIDSHKGKIWVNSLEGKGTTVSIFLPSNQNPK